MNESEHCVKLHDNARRTVLHSSLDSPSSVTLSTTEPNTRMSVLPSVLPPNPLSLLRPAGPGDASTWTR